MKPTVPVALLRMRERAERSPNGYVDVDRICALPLTRPMSFQCDAWKADPERALCPEHLLAACPRTDVDAWSAAYLLESAYAGGFRFWEAQARAMRDWAENGGLLAPIGVGFGKTMITQWIAQHDYTEGLAQRVLLLVPSQVYDQTMRHAMAFARTHMVFTMPVWGYGGQTPKTRRAMTHRMRPGLYVMPHSLLSTEDTEATLSKLDPQTVIVDECHRLSNLSAARAQRFRRFMRQGNRRAAFLSGTITKKSVKDYAPLLGYALGVGSPLPASPRMASDWAQVLDSDASPGVVSTGPLAPLRAWARDHFPSHRRLVTEDLAGTRRAFQLRLNATPGVVSTGDAQIGTSLLFRNVPCETPPNEELAAIIKTLETDMITPNGDEIEYPIHLYKWRFELYTTGGYNELIWPTPQKVVKAWSLAFSDHHDEEAAAFRYAQQRIEQAQHAHELHQLYARELRLFIDATQARGLDTPMLVGGHCARFRANADFLLCVPADLYALWLAWHEAKARATDEYGRIVERESRFVRVDPSRAEHAALTAVALRETSLRGGDNGSVLVWCYHEGFAVWVAGLLGRVSPYPPSLYCPAGANAEIHDAQNAGKIVVASISAHGEGKNLQGYGETLFAQTPRQATVFEQAVGRNHRGGQTRDEMTMHTMLSSPFEHASYAAMLTDALYIQQTTGSRQKAVVAAYDPMPEVVPGAVLRERGIPDARELSRAMQQDLLDRFGGAQ